MLREGLWQTKDRYANLFLRRVRTSANKQYQLRASILISLVVTWTLRLQNRQWLKGFISKERLMYVSTQDGHKLQMNTRHLFTTRYMLMQNLLRKWWNLNPYWFISIPPCHLQVRSSRACKRGFRGYIVPGPGRVQVSALSFGIAP